MILNIITYAEDEHDNISPSSVEESKKKDEKVLKKKRRRKTKISQLVFGSFKF